MLKCLGLTILFLIFYSEAKAQQQCPHPDFVRNHVCDNCKTEEDARQFTRKNRPGHDNDNFVFNRATYKKTEGMESFQI